MKANEEQAFGALGSVAADPEPLPEAMQREVDALSARADKAIAEANIQELTICYRKAVQREEYAMRAFTSLTRVYVGGDHGEPRLLNQAEAIGAFERVALAAMGLARDLIRGGKP